ncbi:MAG: hypothetical protein A2496_07420 [Burkholderiales bacterium RIFOXYC12_FULL_60_6]|nr:MAG: hypothetical protein A2503_10955 [Burkholderiales bacterium RIFOXYD12_FULL_59_19]OGB81314.1 MAG: hypothetical protein A2496_07420 [Burkholderiales bacterium RIFOXYC12_FULL_60_6]
MSDFFIDRAAKLPSPLHVTGAGLNSTSWCQLCRAIPKQQRRLETLQFLLQVASAAEVPVGLVVPVLGIFQITLLNVQDAVQPGSQAASGVASLCTSLCASFQRPART